MNVDAAKAAHGVLLDLSRSIADGFIKQKKARTRDSIPGPCPVHSVAIDRQVYLRRPTWLPSRPRLSRTPSSASGIRRASP